MEGAEQECGRGSPCSPGMLVPLAQISESTFLLHPSLLSPNGLLLCVVLGDKWRG